jgi:hypothetical protein
MAADSIDFSKLDSTLTKESMAAAWKAKEKEMQAFKDGIADGEVHAAKIAKKKTKALEEEKKKIAEQEEKVKRLIIERKGGDADDADQQLEGGGGKGSKVYSAFSSLDTDNSGRISTDELERYLAGDGDYHYTAYFTQADVGLKFYCPSPNVIYISEIEPLSPASRNLDLTAGLRLLSYNDLIPNLDRPGYASWSEVKKREETLKWLALMIDKTEDTFDPEQEEGGGGPYCYKFLEPKYVFTQYTNKFDFELQDPSSGSSQAGVIKSIAIKIGAYNTHEDLILELQQKIRQSTSKFGKFKVLYDRELNSYRLDSGGVVFRMLLKTGPNRYDPAGPTLGFHGGDSGWDDHFEGNPRSSSIDLNRIISPEQIKVLTKELVDEVDDSGNGIIEFQEFTKLYAKYLSTPSRKAALVSKIVERFLSAGEKLERNIVLAEKAKQQRRKDKMEKGRSKQKAIARSQILKRQAVGSGTKDANGVVRHRAAVESIVPIPTPVKETLEPVPLTKEELKIQKFKAAEKGRMRKQAGKREYMDDNW